MFLTTNVRYHLRMEYSKVLKHGLVPFIRPIRTPPVFSELGRNKVRALYIMKLNITVSLLSTHFDPESSGTQFPSDLGLALFNSVSLCGLR